MTESTQNRPAHNALEDGTEKGSSLGLNRTTGRESVVLLNIEAATTKRNRSGCIAIAGELGAGNTVGTGVTIAACGALIGSSPMSWGQPWPHLLKDVEPAVKPLFLSAEQILKRQRESRQVASTGK